MLFSFFYLQIKQTKPPTRFSFGFVVLITKAWCIVTQVYLYVCAVTYGYKYGRLARMHIVRGCITHSPWLYSSSSLSSSLINQALSSQVSQSVRVSQCRLFPDYALTYVREAKIKRIEDWAVFSHLLLPTYCSPIFYYLPTALPPSTTYLLLSLRTGDCLTLP